MNYLIIILSTFLVSSYIIYKNYLTTLYTPNFINLEVSLILTILSSIAIVDIEMNYNMKLLLLFLIILSYVLLFVCLLPLLSSVSLFLSCILLLIRYDSDIKRIILIVWFLYLSVGFSYTVKQ